MKAHSTQLLTLSEMANKELLAVGEGAHKKETFLMWALDYYRLLRMDYAKEIKTVQVEMTPWKSIIMPDDCVDPIAVGIKCGNMIKTFVVSNDIATRDCSCDEEEMEACTNFDNMDVSGEGVRYYGFNEQGENPGKMFGLLLKNNGLGYYTINHNQGVNEIQLKLEVNHSSRIYLMYLSTLFDPMRDSVVHPYAEDMVRKGIAYEYLKYSRRSGNRRISGDMVAEAKFELDNEKCLLAERKCEWTVETVMEIIREGYRMTPKF